MDEAARRAREEGHTGIVKLLLADSRVNPDALADEAIRHAAKKGHINTVKLLLLDSRVDPGACENVALNNAIISQHKEMAKSLVAGRVERMHYQQSVDLLCDFSN